MSKLDKVKIIAEIVELGAKAYSLIKERRRVDRDQVMDEKIRKLERDIEDLKKQLAEAQNE